MAHLKVREIPKDDEVGQILYNEMTHEFQKSYITIDDDGTCVSELYLKVADEIENFEVRNSDVWVCTYPKSGTTWTQEMVWLIENNFDYEAAKIDLALRFPFLELCTVYDSKKMDEVFEEKTPDFVSDSVEHIKNMEGRRFIKTRLPFSLLPKQIRDGSKTPTIFYVMRNPKDVCVSYYHHYKLLLGCKAGLENFTKVFLGEKVMYGSYWKNVLSYWEKRDLPNVFLIKYEDMKKDLHSVIMQVAKFLNKTLNDEQMERLIKHLSFESMKNNRAVNVEDILEHRRKKNLVLEEGTIMRSGTVGKYKDELSPEVIKKFDEWNKKNTAGTGFNFYDKEY